MTHYTIVYTWQGFFSPIANESSSGLNLVHAVVPDERRKGAADGRLHVLQLGTCEPGRLLRAGSPA
jgi:hypothetical protein